MKQFDIETYNRLVADGKTPKIVTRDRCPVRILCTDRKHPECIVALVDLAGHDFVIACFPNGHFFKDGEENEKDLFFADLEPTYRPYANAQEFLAAQREHGPHITACGQYHLPTLIDDGCIVTVSINGGAVSEYDNVFKLYRWQDGSPCGVKEE